VDIPTLNLNAPEPHGVSKYEQVESILRIGRFNIHGPPEDMGGVLGRSRNLPVMVGATITLLNADRFLKFIS
jgi:hypothetical protein